MQEDITQFLTPGTDSSVVFEALDGPGHVSERAYRAEYNGLGIKTNQVIPLTVISSGNNAGMKNIVGSSSSQTTQTPVSPSGNVQSSSAVGYNSGTGWWIGFDKGIPKLFIGNSAGNKITWDGTSLNISGNLTASSIDIPDATSPASFHVDSSGNTWWGATTFANAFARISSTGNAQFVGLSSLTAKSNTIFETAARFGSTNGGTGSATFGLGLDIATGGTGTSFQTITLAPNNDVCQGNPTFSISFSCVALTAASGSGKAFFGVGSPTIDGSGMTNASGQYFGFLVTKAAGVVSLQAQLYDSLPQVLGPATMTTLVDGDYVDAFAVSDGGVVYFYYRKNSGALNLANRTVLSGSGFNASNSFITFATTNSGTAFNYEFNLLSASYER